MTHREYKKRLRRLWMRRSILSGYRDEPASAFDPIDAGEVMEPDEY